MSEPDQKATLPTSVTFVTVPDELEGQRIDNFLKTQLKGVPKSLIYRIVRKGEVRVNKKRIKPEYKLRAGDTVRIPPVRVAERAPAPVPSSGLTDTLNAAILYEDKDVIIVNKPSGLAVHGGSGVSLGLIEAFRQMRPECKFLELVHRLDRDTSGCIMMAKKRSALKFLHEALKGSRITKIYHALVEGAWASQDRRIEAPLLKNELKSGERIVKVDAEGKACLTEYKVLRRFGRVATLVEARPITGRTHQIRVHCQFVGHGIAGDPKYSRDEFNKAMRGYGVKRLFLHAAQLRVPLPSGERIIIDAPLEEGLTQAIKALAKEGNA
ncbi:MAG: 23S rRNA pseudouridine(955/2504/2580) synthase RluC [Pontibacterium sp.]